MDNHINLNTFVPPSKTVPRFPSEAVILFEVFFGVIFAGKVVSVVWLDILSTTIFSAIKKKYLQI